jgi:hypothetical protein
MLSGGTAAAAGASALLFIVAGADWCRIVDILKLLARARGELGSLHTGTSTNRSTPPTMHTCFSVLRWLLTSDCQSL